MPEESTRETVQEPSASGALPDLENLADSDDADVILARAKLLEAGAKHVKANTPLLDKIIIRGLLPIALAIVGPWALWKFDASTTEQKKQGEVIVELQEILESEREDAAARQTRSIAWRARMKTIEEEKAVELTAMTNMVCRLDDMLKTALVQMAVARSLHGEVGTVIALPPRADVIRQATEQIQLPGVEEADVKRIAGQQYDRMAEQRQAQEQR